MNHHIKLLIYIFIIHDKQDSKHLLHIGEKRERELNLKCINFNNKNI